MTLDTTFDARLQGGSFWWVTQTETFHDERAGQFLWAPISTEAGVTRNHWTNMSRVRAGDIAFCYHDDHLVAIAKCSNAAYDAPKPAYGGNPPDWDGVGRRVDAEYFDLSWPIPIEAIPAEVKQALAVSNGPLNRNLSPNQGYLFAVAAVPGHELLALITENNTLPESLSAFLLHDSPAIPRISAVGMFPRVHNVHGIYLTKKLLRALDRGVGTLPELVSEAEHLTFRRGLRQPHSYIAELLRFSRSTGLAQYDNETWSLTPLGYAFLNASASEERRLSDAQASLLRDAIIMNPEFSATYNGIVLATQLLRERGGQSDAHDIAGRIAELLGASDRINAETQLIWAKCLLKYCAELSLITEDGAITAIGREFVSRILQEAVRGEEIAAALSSRGGIQTPHLRQYVGGLGVAVSSGTASIIDSEARRQALDRRKAAHQRLQDAVAGRAPEGAVHVEQSQYADLVIDRSAIIEIKSLEEDDLSQVQAAVGQLHIYRFLHRRDVPNAKLLAVFNRRPKTTGDDLVKCLELRYSRGLAS